MRNSCEEGGELFVQDYFQHFLTFPNTDTTTNRENTLNALLLKVLDVRYDVCPRSHLLDTCLCSFEGERRESRKELGREVKSEGGLGCMILHIDLKSFDN